MTPSTPEALRPRIRSLTAEIRAAEAKIPRMVEAIQTRKQTLARLQAQLAMIEPRQAQVAHECT